MSQGCEAEHLCLGFGWEGGLALGEERFFPRGDGGGSGSRGILPNGACKWRLY